ncbi:hypothetical protein HFP51_08135 [Parasphingopyxis sp. CP4]|uniref:hypothetical protein n=1 Tax=Parasphingopyxis sp. CP4 TaxID=2724527 RepID=UPI0015A09F22|nr:hypothetical protein [Parasphingopyxis sp. CP4]QLC22148.1 hypothetical protein HFP51_08135 [Parasphingopyxis sp. CP4]
MTSESSPEPDPRRKRALYIGGAIALAAIVWNFDGFDDRDPVQITIEDSDIRDARDTIRREIRESVRAGVRGERDQDREDDEATDGEEESADGDATEAGTAGDADATAEDADATADEEVVSERTVGDRRIVETRSDSNQRSFRIEDDDGDGITISVDAEPAE